jgi:hypothetical protein
MVINIYNYILSGQMQYLFYLLLPALFIVSYGKYRCTHKNFKDPLEKELVHGIDGWAVSHVFCFMTLGYFYPQSFIPSMTVGILWELFEHYYGENRPGWLGGYGDCNDLATDKKSGNWWYGKWSDILCNMSGFLVGRGMSKR